MESLYIHIPFCHRICTYCDFVKEVAHPDKQAAYLDALATEFALYKDRLEGIKTIFIGGGTPSSLPLEQLQKLFTLIRSHVDLDKVIEFTIECNPSDITPAKARCFKAGGINRISLGVQTFKAKQLAFLNRDHREEDVVAAIDILKAECFANISVDMLFALIDQTLADVKEDLKKVLTLDITHISYYSLILESGTRLYTLYKKGEIALTEETLETEMYETVIETLVQHGFEHYEVSNFALDGNHCRHNLHIWKDGDYLGLGLGAHAKYDDRRSENTGRVKTYIESINETGKPEQIFYPYEDKRDYLLNGLRLIKGVDLSEYQARFGTDLLQDYPALKKYLENNLLKMQAGRLAFTRRGLFLGNEVFQIF